MVYGHSSSVISCQKTLIGRNLLLPVAHARITPFQGSPFVVTWRLIGYYTTSGRACAHDHFRHPHTAPPQMITGWCFYTTNISFTNYSYCFCFCYIFFELSLIIRFVFVFVIFFLELSIYNDVSWFRPLIFVFIQRLNHYFVDRVLITNNYTLNILPHHKKSIMN